MEKIFIIIQNSFSKYVEELLTPYLFSGEILHLGGKLENRSFRKQHSITDPLITLKIGSQTRPGLALDIKEIEDFF